MTDGKRPPGRPPERLKVIVLFKRAMSSPPAEVEEVLWPKGWRLPQTGDDINVGGRHGFVSHLTYDLTNGVIKVNTR